FDEFPGNYYELGVADNSFFLAITPDFNLNSNSPGGKLAALFQEFPLIARTDGTIGMCNIGCHFITCPDYQTVCDKLCHYPLAQSDEIEKQVADLLSKGLVRPSKSPFGANPVLVKKPDGTYRMTINYRSLNSVTVKNARPMPKASLILRLLPSGGWY